MASKYSTIPQVIDYLYGQITTAAAGQPDTVVVDGYPGKVLLNGLIAIGGTVEPVADPAYEAVSLGAKRIEEAYQIPINISAYRGGSSSDSANGEKQARDFAFVLYDLVVGVLAADPSLGNLVNWCLPKELMVNGTNNESATEGVDTIISFKIEVHARITFR